MICGIHIRKLEEVSLVMFVNMTLRRVLVSETVMVAGEVDMSVVSF